MNIKSDLKIESKNHRRIAQLKLVSKRALKLQELKKRSETESLAKIDQVRGAHKRNTISQKNGP